MHERRVLARDDASVIGSAMAAPQKTPVVALAVPLASPPAAASRAGDATTRAVSSSRAPHEQRGTVRVLSVDQAHGVLAGVAEVPADDLLLGRRAHTASSTMAKPARFTPMSVGDL